MSPTEGYVATCAGMVYQRSCCGLQEALLQKFPQKTFCRPAFPKIPEPNGLILNSRINSY